MTNLEGRHALVTGGGTGIGAAIALALAESGATVTICGRRQQPLDDTANQHANIHSQVCDITDEQEVADLFQRSASQHGPVELVIANAGSAGSAPLHRTERQAWQEIIDINLTGTFLTLRQGLRGILDHSSTDTADENKAWGRLICIASNAGLKGFRYVSAYSAAKHGVIGLMRSAALETAGSNITVNAICPGFTDTPLLSRSVDTIASRTGASKQQAKASLEKMNQGGKLVQPSEIAAAVLWLAGPESGSVNGQAIEISGGAA